MQAAWVGQDGAARPIRIKGGPLFEAFHGLMNGGTARDLKATPGHLADAYASEVWTYRCIKLRSDAVAGVPLVLREQDGTAIEDHPLLDLLRDVNPQTMNLGDLLRATEAALNIWGVAYWLKIRVGKAGRIKWIQWLNPQTIEIESDARLGVLAYKQTLGADVRRFRPDEVITFRNFNPHNDLGGLSPLSVALNPINTELNAGRYVAAFFNNDARPAGLLSTDQIMHDSDIERVQSWWTRLFGGVLNKWRTGIVGSGLRWQTISYPPRDLALPDLREEDRRAICAAFGVPAGLAGAWETTTYATAREQKASFYEDTILPQLRYLSEMLNFSLLPHYPDLTARGARLEFDIDSITALRESATDKAARLVMLLNAGVIGRDEVRAELGLPEAVDATQQVDGAGRGESPLAPTTEIDSKKEAKAKPANPIKAMRRDLARWKRFALKRFARGQPLREFRSEIIPAPIVEQINAGLVDVKSADEIGKVFEGIEAMAA
jgi:HK97 family phage portal protein